uniref:DEAD domain-containing protein n=1 Tax=Parastrongyloides trichosuri TaxID=131310 RepID=A0A0N4ZFL5_PARTI
MNKIDFCFALKHHKIKVFSNIDDGDLVPSLQTTLHELGITTLYPLQEYLVPAITEKSYDILIESKNGTGKKFGYVLGIVNHILQIQSQKSYVKFGDPFAVILMQDIERSKEVIGEINRLSPSTKVVKLIGSDNEINFVNLINNEERCVIVGSIVKCFKLINCFSHLLKRDIPNANFIIFDGFEKLKNSHWKNYIDDIVKKSFATKNENQIRIFSSDDLDDNDPTMLMEQFSIYKYVIMKFHDSINTPLFSNGLSNIIQMKEQLQEYSRQSSQNDPKIILTRPENKIVINNITNNQQFISNQAYYNRPELPMGKPFLIDEHSKFVRRSVMSTRMISKFVRPIPPLSMESYHTARIVKHVTKRTLDKETFEDLIEKENNKFDGIGVVKNFEIIQCQIFDLYDNLLKILKNITANTESQKILVFIENNIGCIYGSNLCSQNGIESRIASKDSHEQEIKESIKSFLNTNIIVFFIQNSLISTSKYIQNLHGHTIISTIVNEKMNQLQEKKKYLGHNSTNGGLLIKMLYNDIDNVNVM